MSEDVGGPAEDDVSGGAGESGGGSTAAGASEERLGSQAELLGEMKALRRQARAARHAYWFPLVLFGLLTCASVPFYVRPARWPGAGLAHCTNCGDLSLPYLGGMQSLEHAGLGYYWLIALLGWLLLTQLWYRWHARRVGLATPSLAYLSTTAVLTVLAMVIPLLSLLRSQDNLSWLQRIPVIVPGDLVARGTFPFVIIAIGLLVLAWAERSRALGVIVAVYAGTALLASLYDIVNVLYRLGWDLSPGLQLLPNVLLPALVLLVAGAGAFAAQWRRQSRGHRQYRQLA